MSGVLTRQVTTFALLFMLGAAAGAETSEDVAAKLCRAWFGTEALCSAITLASTNVVISEVTLNGSTAGWLFRTDQVPPVCKGKRGEIVALVAVGADAHIKGLQVLSHKEDARYFKRLKSAFFEQFLGRCAADLDAKLDAVTHATLSSRAIIRDVMEGARQVTALPEVAAKLHAGE